MKTLILLTALAAIATAGPTFLDKDTIDQDSRLNGVLKTIKRERKSPVQESPSKLFSNVPEKSETLQISDVKASSAGRNSGFNKPIIVKKKFGYRIYRDSDEELAQAEPRENCRSQFRFKLCDEGSDQISTALRNTQTEDIDESDVGQSLRMAKEAVESLQRDLLKIERNTKLAKNKFEEKLDNDAKEYRQKEERFVENNDETTQSKASTSVTDAEISNSDDKRMVEWKEAIENIQKNVGIFKNTEDTLKMSTLNNLPFEEENNLLKSRKTESIDSTKGSDSLTKHENIETKQDTQKSAEENMETYATENKDVQVGLLSDSLKIEKAVSSETTDILRNVENDKSLIRDTKQDDVQQLSVQGKSSETLLDSLHEVKSTIFSQGELNKVVNSAAKLTQNGDGDIKNDARSSSLENIEDKTFKSNIEDMKVMRQDENTKKDAEDIQAKAALEEMKDVNLKENKMEVNDVETSESRNSDTLLSENESLNRNENKEKSAMTWIPYLLEKTENAMDLKAKSSDSKIEVIGDQESLQRNAHEKSENVNIPIEPTSFVEVEQKKMREAGKADENLWSLEPILDKTHEHVDALKLREAEGGNKVNNIVQARNIATTSIEESKTATEEKNMRNSFNGEEKQWTVEPWLNKIKDFADAPKLREEEDIHEKLEVNDFVQARNVENEDTEGLIDSKKHTEEKSAVISSTASFDDALRQELNKEKSLFQKSAETKNEDKQKFHLKTQKHSEPNENHNNKQDSLKERNTVEATKTSPLGELTDLHALSSQNNNVDSERMQNKANTPEMKMSEMDYYNDLGSQHSAQLIQDKNIDIHASSHLKDTVSNWNREKYYQNIHEPYLDRWPHDRMRNDGHLDFNGGHLHNMQHHHLGNMHPEGEPHRFLPMGRFVNNHQMEHQHDLLNDPAIKDNMQENGRASEWDIAMDPSMNMDMRHALDKNGMPWGFHRHAGFGSSISMGGPASGGPGTVGLFPGANSGCGIPLLLSCSPSVVSGSLAKTQSLRYNDPAFRSGDDLRFYAKRDVKKHEDKPTQNAQNYFFTKTS